MKLKALKEVRYASVQHFPGDEFEASARDAKLLILIGKAEAVADAALEAVAEASEEVPDDKPKRTYKTRRMKAEE